MRPPVITRVCRESRNVALETGTFVKAADNPNFQSRWPWNPLRYYWSSPATDVVHLNWGWNSSLLDEDFGETVSFFLQEAADSAVASLTAGFLFPFMEPFPCPWFIEDCSPLERRKDYFVTVIIVNLHVSIDQATGSGLFGRLAEERVKLVDPADEEALLKCYQLWLSGTRLDCEPADFFQQAVLTKTFHAQVASWRRRLSEYWAWCKWTRAENDGLTDIEEPDRVWIDRSEDGDDGENVLDSSWPGFLNKNHSWVKRTLGDMPKFSPMVMFRFCEERCYDCY